MLVTFNRGFAVQSFLAACPAPEPGPAVAAIVLTVNADWGGIYLPSGISEPCGSSPAVPRGRNNVRWIAGDGPSPQVHGRGDASHGESNFLRRRGHLTVIRLDYLLLADCNIHCDFHSKTKLRRLW